LLVLTRSTGQRVRVGADRLAVREVRRESVTLEVLPRGWTLHLRPGESREIRPGVSVKIARLDGPNHVRLGFDAPRDVIIHREEIARKLDAEKAEADREEREGGSWR
jgi:carbon storage regulator CsrA